MRKGALRFVLGGRRLLPGGSGSMVGLANGDKAHCTSEQALHQRVNATIRRFVISKEQRESAGCTVHLTAATLSFLLQPALHVRIDAAASDLS
jgi:hypothetical protein